MTLHGKNFIGGRESALGSKQIFAFDPKRGQQLPTAFIEATEEEIQQAMDLAEEAFGKLRESSAAVIAGFLEAIAAEVEGLGDELIDLASTESGLGKERLVGERARTVGQLRLFASVVKE